MKRVVFVTTSFETGAIPNILLDLAPLWRKQGWDCVFLALEPLPEGQASVARCRQLGFPLHSLDVGPRSVVLALWRLRRKLIELHPDLISTHLGRADIYVPWVKGRVPMITTHHNVLAHHGRLTRWGYQISDRLVAARTGVSQACNDSFVDQGFLQSPHRVITNPVSPSRLIPGRDREALLRSCGWSGKVKLLVCVARLAPQKGHLNLIEALARLKAQGHGELRLVLAGEGPSRAEIETSIAGHGLGSEVKLLGDTQSVADLYAAADAMVLTSLWEGLGLVIVEAWCLGCPVAVSALPAIEEFVVDWVNGVLFDPLSVESIAQGIERLLADEEKADAMGQRGKELALTRFSPDSISRQYAVLFDEILAGSQNP